MQRNVSRQASEQLNCPMCASQPSGSVAPRRIWACRLHWAHRIVTSGAFSVILEVLLRLYSTTVHLWHNETRCGVPQSRVVHADDNSSA
jgi:hypothetical protein